MIIAFSYQIDGEREEERQIGELGVGRGRRKKGRGNPEERGDGWEVGEKTQEMRRRGEVEDQRLSGRERRRESEERQRVRARGKGIGVETEEKRQRGRDRGKE